MRKHKTKYIPQYDVTYRPITINASDKDFIVESGKLYKHQKEYVHLMAIFDSLNKDSVKAQVDCGKCNKSIEFDINRNAVMVDEFNQTVFGDDIKLAVHPRITGDEDIPDLIDFVVINGEQIPWGDCKESEKEAVLESIDYHVFKSILTALEQPALVSNIPVRCSCGHDSIVSMRGLEAFLKVVG
jgi:transcription elongation factor Elf1